MTMRAHTAQRGSLLAAVIALATMACSKSDPPGGDDGTGGTGSVGTDSSCTSSQIEILFSPMYSAFDGVHRFQVPATVDGIDVAAVTWSISDPTIASLQTNADGVMITIQAVGKATIVARAGTLCGTSLLTVTSASTDHWTVGSARYTSGEVLTIGTPGTGPRPGDAGATREVACTSCHGDTATTGPFKTVSHTPMQTGGFSDQELIQIFTAGVLPEGAYFDDEIVSRQQWSQFHRWTMTDEQAAAMVIYLRSLTPESQKGSRADFGGRRMVPDGGFPGSRDAGAN
jgi:hypothetical protein